MNKAKSENVLLAKATQKIGWDLHSFSGIFIGLLLFVFFYGGAFSLFLHDLHQWERPAERIAFEGAPASTDALLAPLWARYDFTGQNLSVGMPTARHPVLSTYVRDEDKTVSVDPHTLDFVAEQESVPGDLLYGLHFLNIVHTHEPGPVYFLMWGTASIVSLIGLVAILTGLLIYLPRIKLDIFRFRLRTPGRRRWLDAHNVIGTMSLPFALILSFTGAIICVAHVLFLVFMPAMGGPPGPEAAEGFGGGMEPNVATMMAIDPAATVSLASAPETETKLLDEAPIGTVRYPSVDAMVARVHERWPAIPIRELTIHNVGSSTSVVSITADDEISVIAGASNMGAAKMYFRADTGELLETVGPDAPYSVTSSVWQFIINLHFATFGGPLLKPLYFVLALSFGFAILAGNVVWTRSRRGVHPERRAFYDRVDRLTVGIGAGILSATAVMFLANKLIPMTLEGRAIWEEAVFWCAWAIAVSVAMAMTDPRRSCRLLLAAAGISAGVLPLANGLVTGDWLWVALKRDLLSVFWFDLVALASGSAALFAATRIRIVALPQQGSESEASDPTIATPSLQLR